MANIVKNAMNAATDAVQDAPGTLRKTWSYTKTALKWGGLTFAFLNFSSLAIAAAPGSNLITGAIPAIKAMGAGAVAHLPEAATILTNSVTDVGTLLGNVGNFVSHALPAGP